MLFLIVFFRFMVSFSPILGGGRFPANQRRPMTAGPVFLLLNSGEALFFILYLSSFVFHCFVRGSKLGFVLWVCEVEYQGVSGWF